MLIIIALLLVAIVAAIVSLVGSAGNTSGFVPVVYGGANTADTALLYLRQVLL